MVVSYLFLEHPGLPVVDLEHLLLPLHHVLRLVLDARRHRPDTVQLKISYIIDMKKASKKHI